MNQEHRITIAEACGWNLADEDQIKERAGAANWLLQKGPWWRNDEEKTIATLDNLPDHLNDLNAIHDARKSIINTPELRVKYLNTLRTIVGKRCPKNNVGAALVSDYDLVNAEASEHAEAIIRTIGKWVEA